MELKEAIEKATSWMGTNILYADALNAWFFTFPAPENPIDTIGIGGPVAYLKDTGEQVSVAISQLNGGRFGKQIAKKFGMEPRKLLDTLKKIEYTPVPID